jgi:dihydroneopterin triphosphate diphosphatase
VLVVVFTAGGDVLLLKRSQPFEFWQSVTGSLRPDESHAAAASRELTEETGLTDQGTLTFTGTSRQFAIDERWRNRFPAGTVENVEYEYQYCLPRKVAVMLRADEHSDSNWLPVDQAIDRVWSWTNQAALRQLQVML